MSGKVAEAHPGYSDATAVCYTRLKRDDASGMPLPVPGFPYHPLPKSSGYPSNHAEVFLQLLTVFLTAFMLVACARSDSPPGPESVGNEAAAVPIAASTSGDEPTASSTMPTPAASVSSVARAAATSVKLALDGEGLRVFSVPSGASRLIAFGQSEADTLRALEGVFGASPVQQARNIDCGATLAKWSNGLTTWFSRGRFVGWSLGSDDRGPSSASGLRVGMARGELENGASTVEIRGSTLGTEFQSGGMAGLLESPDADARVTNLWAGATCIAR